MINNYLDDAHFPICCDIHESHPHPMKSSFYHVMALIRFKCMLKMLVFRLFLGIVVSGRSRNFRFGGSSVVPWRDIQTLWITACRVLQNDSLTDLRRVRRNISSGMTSTSASACGSSPLARCPTSSNTAPDRAAGRQPGE